MARLRRGGVPATAVDSAGDAAAAQQLRAELALSPPDQQHVIAVISSSSSSSSLPESVPPGCVPLVWPEGAPATAAMQALVQHNARLEAGGDGETTGAAAHLPLIVVGYAMKATRERQLAEQGLLPLLPSAAGGGGGGGARVAFMPLDLSRPLAAQGRVDAVLHKASDELVAVGGGGAAAAGPAWSQPLAALQAELALRRRVCVVDPFEAAARVVDRAALCHALEGLEGVALPNGVRARAPRHIVLSPPSELAAAGLPRRLEAAGLAAGSTLLVKPLAACGLPESHAMALARHPAALPLLAADFDGAGAGAVVVQEFANHGGVQFKAYALGAHVFCAPRASIPDVAPAPDGVVAGPDALERLVLRFDSLKSLPTRLPAHMAAAGGSDSGNGDGDGAADLAAAAPLDQQALEAVAAFLRARLGLSLFGFDVVVASATGEWLVVVRVRGVCV